MFQSKDIRINATRLKTFPDNVITSTFKTIFVQHTDKYIVCNLDNAAQQYYDGLNDTYAENFNRQYDTTSGNY